MIEYILLHQFVITLAVGSDVAREVVQVAIVHLFTLL